MKQDTSINSRFAIDNLGDHEALLGHVRLKSVFQPIISATGRDFDIYGFEALARPIVDGASVSPKQVFNGSILPGNQTADHVSRKLHIKNFQRIKSDKCFLFLNINPENFSNLDSVNKEIEELSSEIWSSGYSPSRIVFELVENPNSNDEVMQILCEGLRQTGGKIAVDDYGIDYSDWERFQLVQPEVLKLDDEVFANLCKSPFAVRALKQLNTSLSEIGTTLLVEGVETHRQYEICATAGISLLQGFYFGLPQSAYYWATRPSSAGVYPELAPLQPARQFAIN